MISVKQHKANQIQQAIAELNQRIIEAVEIGLIVEIYHTCGSSITPQSVEYTIKEETIYCRG